MVAWFIPIIAAAMGNSDNATMRAAGQLMGMGKKKDSGDIAKENTKSSESTGPTNTKSISDMI